MTQRVYPVSGLFENISELQPNNIVFVDANGTVSELAVGNNLQVNGGQLDVVLAADVYVAMEGTNIGTGTGVFAVRDGNTLKFKSIQGGSSKVVVTNDAENLYVHVVGVADYTHTHLISDVTGLQTVLDNKSNIGHTHVVADITNFNSSVNSIIGASSINALSDVFIDTPIIHQFLVYDGSQWTNSTISYTFLSLQDTPITYIGQANKLVRVNAAQTGLEFTDSIDIQSINAQTISIQGNDVASSLDNKVDKIVGKGLSTNDYTNYDKGVVDVTDTVNFHSGYSTVLTGGEMTLTGGVNFSISAGTGLVRDAIGNLVEIAWPTLVGSVSTPGDNFIYINNSGSILFSAIKDNYDDIFIGYIFTDATNTSILGFDTIKLPFDRFLFHVGQFSENVINAMIEQGVEFSLQANPNTLNVNVSSGVIWSVFNRVEFPQRTTFRKFYKDSNAIYLEETSTTANQIDNVNWNDTSLSGAAAIKPMSTGFYKKDSFVISMRGNVFYEYGMAEYEHYDDALIAPPPVINPITKNISVVIAHVIVQQGNPVPIAVIDVRPMFSKLWNGEHFREFIETASHHQLNGLERDDHLQYHTDTRGDVRYYQKTELDGGQLDTRYYTETEVDNLLSTKSNTNHIHAVATNSVDGFMSASDHTKLGGIEAGATANQTNSYLLSRANHTGTQDVGTITGLTKSSVGLSNVDNTSDTDKPISSATQNALDDKVDKISGKGLSTNDFTDAYETLLDVHEYALTELGSSINVSGGTITLTGGVNFSISAGVGYTRDNLGAMKRVSWPTLTGSCINSGDNFINVDYQGNIVITSSAAQGDLIALGYIRTAISNTVVVGFSNTRLKGYNHLFNLGELFRSSIGTLVQSGCTTAMQPSPNDLKITVGSGYLWSLFNRFTIADTSTFTKLFNTSDYGFIPDTVTTANEVNTAYYNDPTQPAATALIPLSSNHYKKDLIAITPEGTVFYVYATTQWNTLDDARVAPTPAVPENIKLSIARSAAIISRQGDTTITKLIDIRPMFSRLFDTGQAATAATVISHSDLANLGNDDHLLYHTDLRGDARYYRKTELDSGVLDTRYYTESEIATLLLGKANSVHTHVAADITDLSKSSVGLSNVQNVDQTNASNITSGTLANARLTANLSEIGNIVKSEGDLIAVNGGIYTTRTLSQLKADLSLNNVQNVNQTNASNITSGTLANARLTTNLAQIGGLTFNSGDTIYFNGTTLTNRSPSQYKTDLNLTKSDVGLSNVQNVDQTNASNIASGTLANARLTANLAQIGNITFIANDFIQYNGSSLVNVTPASVKLSLNLTKSDVGLSNVQNVDQTNASNIASGTLANARLTANLAQIGGLTFATNDIITYNGTILTTITPSSYKTLLALTKSDVGLSNVVNSLQVINAGNALSLASGTNASRPTAGTLGRFYYSNDQRIISFDNGTIWDNILPAYAGDVSSSVGGTTLTLATVNSNIGTFNTVTVNGKGLVTGASNVDYLLDSGTNGFVVRTGLGVTTARSVVGTTNQLTVVNGDGVAGDATISIANNPVIPGTASMQIPSGTIAQRDAPTPNGKIRFNTESLLEEISESGRYRPMGRLMQFATGDILQATGTTIMPFDATQPTNTEGFQIWSTTITPTYTNSTIVIICNVWVECSVGTANVSMALYDNATSIAVTSARMPGTNNTGNTLAISKAFLAGTTSPITISARVGPSVASTVYVNRGNTETMGGLVTSYIIMEIY